MTLNITRRTALTGGGLTVLGASVLAGCSKASSADTAGGDVVTSTSTTSAASDTSAPTGAVSSSGKATSPTSSTSSAAASGTEVAKLADIPVGGSLSATLDGAPILLAQPTAGTVVGYSAICTHQGCTVAAKGSHLDCPCHGSSFDAATGNVLQGPAPSPLAKLSVSVSGTSVVATK